MVHQGQDLAGAGIQGHEGARVAPQGGVSRPLVNQVQGQIDAAAERPFLQARQEAAGSGEGAAQLGNLDDGLRAAELTPVDGPAPAIEETVGPLVPASPIQDLPQSGKAGRVPPLRHLLQQGSCCVQLISGEGRLCPPQWCDGISTRLGAVGSEPIHGLVPGGVRENQREAVQVQRRSSDAGLSRLDKP